MEAQYIHMSNNIIKIAIRLALAACLSLGLLVAHNGMEHITGTVAKISDTSITVNTTAGKMVEVAFDAKTTFTKASQPFAKADVKVGERVVVHAAGEPGKYVAQIVQLGAATKAAAHGDNPAAEHAEHHEHK
jgi:hypothetical protein